MSDEAKVNHQEAADRWGVPLEWYEREHDRMTAELKEALAEHMAEAMAQWLVQQKVAEPRWIPVGERLPEDGQEVLIARVGTDWIGVCYFRAENVDFEMSGPIAGWFATPAPTHWMPLPEPPKP